MTEGIRVAAQAGAGRGRASTIVLWAVQIITAAGFALAASAKFAGDPAVVETFDAIGFGDWFRYLIAVLELAGAVALLVSLLAGLAGLAFVGLMAGAVLVHLVVLGEGVAAALPLLALAAIVALARRGRTARRAGRAGQGST
ncbi:DoxX family protein [Haloechinothrix sp. YIM 98757]|uniref:DoxX family protein n=1 Tax=Haloechinothrix aidingensis TaxID=2752311 RepID=A0A838ABK9_9PSEU|nr:DoxX family protein [Haloechinothrix aidingensis]MBA0126623.1 DoxX family protein [Haloechinothrix aidingensis]